MEHLGWRCCVVCPTVRGTCQSTDSRVAPVEVEVEVNLRPTVGRPVCPGVRRQSGTCDQLFFLLEISFRQLRVCYFVAPSLTRGRVCNLIVQLSRRTHDHILLSHLRLLQPGGPGSLYLYPPGTGWPSYTPEH
jgi:hypothetical protein